MFDSDKIDDKSRRRYINDIYLLAAFFMFAGILYLMIHGLMPGGRIVRISVPVFMGSREETVYEYPLDEDGYIVITIDGSKTDVSPLIRDPDITGTSQDNGDALINVIRIEDHKVSMTKANCPDRICVRTKPASRISESIICLPHRVTVSVEAGSSGGSSGPGTDKDDPEEPDFVTW